MAKINVYVPEPPAEYTTEGFRQINQALATVENQLNTKVFVRFHFFTCLVKWLISNRLLEVFLVGFGVPWGHFF